MKRREFMTLLGGATLWPLAARAQQESRVRRVGVLLSAAATEVEYQGYLAAFLQEMRQLGWNEGRNLQIEVRWNAGDAILSRTYAAQLIGLMPDVIVTGSTVNLAAVQQATNTIPIVFVQVAGRCSTLPRSRSACSWSLCRCWSEIEPAVMQFDREPNGGLMLLGDSFTRLHIKAIAELAARYRLPSIAPIYLANTDKRQSTSIVS